MRKNKPNLTDISKVVLTKEQEKQISDSVNRYFRMKRKRIIRKASTIILYPINQIWKLKS
jgi:hypothetical protein